MKRTGRNSSTSAAASRRVRAPAVMANPMAEQVGPEFYDETGMRAALAPAGDELLDAASWRALVEGRGVMAVAAFDGTGMFPIWQVSEGRVLSGLPDVLAAMAGQPVWSVALWVSTPHDALGGRSPRAVLQDGGDPARLVELAAETARRWS